jgi:hypothetical protein
MVGQIARTSAARRPTSTVGRGSLSSSFRPRIAPCNLPAALCMLFVPCVSVCVQSRNRIEKQQANETTFSLFNWFLSSLLACCVFVYSFSFVLFFLIYKTGDGGGG